MESEFFINFKMAEVEPGFILMLLIWMFSSFFSKKKSKKPKALKDDKKISQKFEDILRELGGLSNLDISDKPEEVSPESEKSFYESYEDLNNQDIVDNDIQEDNSHYKDKIDFSPSPRRILDNSGLESINESKIPIKEIKLYGTPLQKVMVLKEILDKPRSLKPFSFEKYD